MRPAASWLAIAPCADMRGSTPDAAARRG
jgi:hypothetical protein